jgi:hypothetical protein
VPSVFALFGPREDFKGEVRWYLINAQSMTPQRASQILSKYHTAIGSGQREGMHPGSVASYLVKAEAAGETPSEAASHVREQAVASRPMRPPTSKSASADDRPYRAKVMSELRRRGIRDLRILELIHEYPDAISNAREGDLPISLIADELLRRDAASRARSDVPRVRKVLDYRDQVIDELLKLRPLDNRQDAVAIVNAHAVAMEHARAGEWPPSGVADELNYVMRQPSGAQRRDEARMFVHLAKRRALEKLLKKSGYSTAVIREAIDHNIDMVDMPGTAHAVAVEFVRRGVIPPPHQQQAARQESQRAASARRDSRYIGPKLVERLPEGWTANVQSQTNPERFCAARTWLGQDKSFLPVIRYYGDDPDVPQIIEAKQYEVCLSKNQTKRLFGAGTKVSKKYGGAGPPRYTSNGTYAGVWKKGDKDILKFTKDAEDVGALLRAGGLRHVRRISKAYLLKGAGHDCEWTEGAECHAYDPNPTPVFAFVSEDVEPVSEHPDRKIRRLGKFLNQFWYDGPTQDLKRYAQDQFDIIEGRPHARPQVIKSFTIPKHIRAGFMETCEGYDNDDGDRDACRQFAREFVQTWQGMARRGIVAWDMHSGNIGVSAGKRTKKGTWMIIDAGLSSQDPPKEKVEELRAAWKREADRGRRNSSALLRLGILGVATALVVALPQLRR